jgi:tripartite ATP-independent transporter DctP family solute receptor
MTALFLGGCAADEDVRVLRLAHSLDVTHPVHLGMAYMAQRVEQLSEGELRIQIFPNGQLGGERETAELLQLGSVDITKVASSVIENFVPSMAVFSLPYLFDDADHYWTVFQSDLGRDILLEGEQYWMRGLTYYDAGFRSFMMRDRAVHEPADLSGSKVRVMQSNIQIQTINALGGHATPMSLGELYTAMQSGVVDGADGNPPTMYQTKLFEVSSYYILDEHSAPPDVMLISTHTWNSLTPQQQAWIDQAVEESIAYQRERWEEGSDRALENMRAAGLTIIEPDKEPFRQAVQPMYDNLRGTRLGDLADQIRAMAPSRDAVSEVRP